MVLSQVSKEIFVFQFCFTMPFDRLTKLTAYTTSEKENQMKVNCDLLECICRLNVFACNSDWFIVLSASVVIGQSD